MKQGYWKYTFTRWWFWLIIILFFVANNKVFTATTIMSEPEYLMANLLGILIVSLIISLIVYSIKKHRG